MNDIDKGITIEGSGDSASPACSNSLRSWPYTFYSRFAILSVNCFVAFFSCNALFSIGGVNTILSIGSLNSMLSIGSVNSFLAIGCSGGFLKNCVSERRNAGSGKTLCGEDFDSNGITFDSEATAGFACDGGTFDGKGDSDGITGMQCLSGGGSWESFTCKGVDIYLYNGSAEKDGMSEAEQQEKINNFWAPKCCLAQN